MFITFEGIDGSGKTTLIKETLQLLVKHTRFSVACTKEPTHDIDWVDNPKKQAEIFAKNTNDHQPEIKELISNYDIVLCDRYIHSNYAYQGARGVKKEDIKKLYRDDIVPPDMIMYVVCRMEDVVGRLQKRNTSLGNKFEQKNYLKIVFDTYWDAFCGEEAIVYPVSNYGFTKKSITTITRETAIGITLDIVRKQLKET